MDDLYDNDLDGGNNNNNNNNKDNDNNVDQDIDLQNFQVITDKSTKGRTRRRVIHNKIQGSDVSDDDLRDASFVKVKLYNKVFLCC